MEGAKGAEIKETVSRPESIDRQGECDKSRIGSEEAADPVGAGVEPPFQFKIAKVLFLIVGAGGDEVEALSEPGEVPIVSHADYRGEEKLIGDGGGDQR